MKSKQSEGNAMAKSEEEIMAEAAHDIAVLKKTLKRLGKNQLIQLVLQQMNLAIEHQNINRVLLAQMESLKEQKGDSNE
jgi:hypothetical protein